MDEQNNFVNVPPQTNSNPPPLTNQSMPGPTPTPPAPEQKGSFLKKLLIALVVLFALGAIAFTLLAKMFFSTITDIAKEGIKEGVNTYTNNTSVPAQTQPTQPNWCESLLSVDEINTITGWNITSDQFMAIDGSVVINSTDKSAQVLDCEIRLGVTKPRLYIDIDMCDDSADKCAKSSRLNPTLLPDQQTLSKESIGNGQYYNTATGDFHSYTNNEVAVSIGGQDSTGRSLSKDMAISLLSLVNSKLDPLLQN